MDLDTMSPEEYSDSSAETGPADALPFSSSFLDSLDNSVLILDSEGTITAINQEYRFFLREAGIVSHDQLTGLDYFELFDELSSEGNPKLTSALRELCAGDRTSVESTFRCSISGKTRRYRLDAQSFRFQESRFITVSHRSISYQNGDFILAEDEDTGELPDPDWFGMRTTIEKTGGTDDEDADQDAAPQVDGFELAHLLRELHETTRHLMSAETPEAVATTACRIANEYFQTATAGVRLLRDGKLVMVSAEKDDERLLGRTPPPYQVGEGFVGETFQSGEATIYDDLDQVKDDISFDYSPMKSAMLLPIGKYGIVSVASEDPGAFDEVDLQLGRQFAADVQSAMERAHREKKLREKELKLRRENVGKRYFRSIIDTLPAGLVITDGDGVVRTVNERLRSMLGYDEDRLKDSDISVIFDDDKEVVDQRINMIKTSTSPLYEETEFLTRSGETVPVFLTGDELDPDNDSSGELVLVGFDITELKLKNRRLRESERRLSLALNAARAGVWEWDLTTKEVFWNENTERLFGFDPGEFDGDYATFAQHVHPDDLPGLERAYEEAIDESGVFETEFRIHTKDGDERWLLSRGEVFTDLGGDPENIIGVVVDVTDHKRTQDALERTLDEKETLLREIHHRVKNNMQIIKSLLSMQKRNLHSEDVQQAFRESINRVRTMAMVHENLYQSEDLANVNFREYIRTLIDNLLGSYGARDVVTVDLVVESTELSLDRSIACGLIVNELVTNSLEHGFDLQEGGRLSIDFVSLDNNRLQLEISDNGKGVDPDFNLDDYGGAGFDIIQSLAEYELNGTLDFETTDDFTVAVTFDR